VRGGQRWELSPRAIPYTGPPTSVERGQHVDQGRGPGALRRHADRPDPAGRHRNERKQIRVYIGHEQDSQFDYGDGDGNTHNRSSAANGKTRALTPCRPSGDSSTTGNLTSPTRRHHRYVSGSWEHGLARKLWPDQVGAGTLAGPEQNTYTGPTASPPVGTLQVGNGTNRHDEHSSPTTDRAERP